MKKNCMKKTPYVKPEAVMIMPAPGILLADSGRSYLDPNPTLEDGWILSGYIYETGHEGDNNYIVDYILEEDEDYIP